MKIEWNKVTWYSKILAVVLGVGILLLGIYIGVMYQRGIEAIELAEQLQIKRPPVIEKKTVAMFEFAQVGNIKNIATGEIEEDEWVLIYEVPGAPALTKRLLFTTKSTCVFGGNATFCDTSKFEQGQRVMVMGSVVAEEVVVERLEVQ